MKLQLALEYMIVFSFVLIIFIFSFALIANQRAVTLSGETSSQLQAVVQQIAQQLNTAQQAGTGYRASVSLTTDPTLLKYNLSVSQTGIVVAKASIGSQIVTATAFSSVSSVSSNHAYLSGTSYQLPIANGTVSLQNSFGTICIDLLCPTTSNTPSSISLSSEITHGALFNGKAGYISSPSTNAINPSSVSVSAWVRINAKSGTYDQPIVEKGGTSRGTTGYELLAGTGTDDYFYVGISGVSYDVGWAGSSATIGNVINLIGTYNSVSGKMTLYYNGYAENTITAATGGITANTNSLYIGGLPGTTSFVNGTVTNVQIYNTSLTQGQVNSIYSGGITGQPLLPANLIAWYPLDGNAYDYAQGNNGAASGPVYFPSIDEILARVTNGAGSPISGAMVGFASSLGIFSSGPSFVNLTNSSGVAKAFLVQQQNNGEALVRATAFNGNATTQSSLGAWWPLNFGQGNATLDLSGNGNNGAFVGYPYWSSPAYAMQFDGQSSYITVANSAVLNSNTFTFNIWVNPALYGNAGDGVRAPPLSVTIGGTTYNANYSSLIAGHGLSPSGGYANEWWFEFRDSDYLNWYVQTSTGYNSVIAYPAFPQLNRWYMLTGTYNSVTDAISLYVDGVLVSKKTLTGTLQVKPYGLVFGGINASDSYGGHFAGEMANAQYYSAVLASPQIMQLYEEGIAGTPIGIAGLIGWWPLNGNANDYSGNGNNGTVIGNTNPVPLLTNTTANQDSTLAANFNGATSMIKLPFTFSSSALTITEWVQPVSQGKMVSSNGYTIFNSTGTSNFKEWLNNGAGLGTAPGSGAQEIGIGTSVVHGYGVNASVWTFIAVVLNRGVASLYINASDPYNVSIPSGPYSVSGLNIGQSANSISPFAGNIADVQVYNSSLSPKQIAQLYYGGITATPLPEADIAGWYPLDGSPNDYSGNGNNGVASNVVYTLQNTTGPTLLNSFGSYGLAFNDYIGSNAYVSVPSSASITPGSAFSLAFWVYKDPQATYCTSLFGKSLCTSFCIYARAQVSCSSSTGYNTAGLQLTFRYTNTAGTNVDNINTIVGIPASTWTFAAMTFGGGNAIWYLNGAETAAYNGLLAPQSTTSNFLIGNGDRPFNGTLADVQFYNSQLSSTQVSQLYGASLPPTATVSVPLGALP